MWDGNIVTVIEENVEKSIRWITEELSVRIFWLSGWIVGE